MDFTTYRHLMGQINKSCIIPHYNFPSHNLLSADTVSKISMDTRNPQLLQTEEEFLSDLPCYQSFQYTIQPACPIICGSGLLDTPLCILKKKHRWEAKLKSIKISDTKSAIQVIKNIQNNKRVYVSKNIIKYIEHIRKDPEPHFSGQYNWMYTGGNIQATSNNNDVILLGPNNDISSATLNAFKLSENFNEIENKLSCTLKKNSHILQVSSKCKGNNLIVAARQKYFVNILLLNMDNAFNYCWRKKVQRTKFFTSLDVDRNCHTVVLADSNCDFHIFDIETKKKTYGFAWRFSDRDKWNQVLLDNNMVYMANREFFSALDSRESIRGPVYEYSPENVTNKCEDICSIIKSQTNFNYFYLGTSHNIIQMDMRMGKAVQKWTHLMKNLPQFLSCAKDDINDFLAVQSNDVNEIVGISNEFKGRDDYTTSVSKSLPCNLGTVNESLRLARMKGLCLRPITSKRLGFSVTGIQCLKSKRGDVHIFTINSAGDIFISQFLNKEICQALTVNENNFLNKMSNFEHSLTDMCTKKPDMSKLKEIDLKGVLKDLRVTEILSDHWQERPTVWKEEEKFTLDSLTMYKDVMSQKILKVWGFHTNESELNQTISVEAKVQEWMQRM